MRLTDRVRVVFGLTPRRATFALTTPGSVDEVMREMYSSQGAATRDEAAQVPAALKARDMIVNGVSTLPLETVDRLNYPVINPLLEQTDPKVPQSVTMAQTVEDLFYYGVAWWRKITIDDLQYPTEARWQNQQSVSTQPPPGNGWQHLLPSGVDPRSVLWVDGKPVPYAEMIRFDSPNRPFLFTAGPAIRTAKALRDAGVTYAENPRPLDYFTPREIGADPDQPKITGLLKGWRRSRKTSSTAYVPSAFEYHTVDTPSPASLQLVELLRQATLDIANAAGIDPEDVGVSMTSRTYQNDVSRRQDRINDVYAGYMAAIQGRLSMDDITQPGEKVRFRLDDYLKADPLTRAQVDASRLADGTLTINEVRMREGRPPLPGGDTPQLHAGTPSGSPLALPSTRTAPIQATVGEPVRYDAPPRTTFSGGARVTFDMEVSAEFAVDTETRTITGLAVPFGAVAKSNGRRYRFHPNSLKYAAVNRVKLLRDHNNSLALGKATKIEQSEAGYVISFKVSQGPAGDEALALAADEVLDGLSIGVDFRDEDMVQDPDNPATWLVMSAALREVSLTAVPAFDDSRLTSVRASYEGNDMKCDKCGLVHADGVTECATAPATFTAEQVQAMFGTMLGSKAGFGGSTMGFVPGVDPTVRPTLADTKVPAKVIDQPNQVTVVREALPYRFDASGLSVFSGYSVSEVEQGQAYDFNTDVQQMRRTGDQLGQSEAGKRVLGTMGAWWNTRFGGENHAEFATVTSAGVAAANPTIQRPDLYVDKRDFRSPLWDSINKGAPPNGLQTITYPKWSSESNLVGAHTEGTEPTGGSVALTTGSITPSALSGAVDMSREVWDMVGNPAASSIVWTRMTNAYQKGLESATATFLNTLTAAADIALGSAVVDEALAAAWDAALADLQFIEDYDWSMFAVEKNLYKAFVAATADDGRKIFPIINPMNANGRASSRFRQLDLSGVVGVPSWALPQTPGSANNSWLFDPSVMIGYATAPQRLEFAGIDAAGAYAPVAMIRIAIWGYKALANTDIGGVRQVTYDTTT